MLDGLKKTMTGWNMLPDKY